MRFFIKQLAVCPAGRYPKRFSDSERINPVYLPPEDILADFVLGQRSALVVVVTQRCRPLVMRFLAQAWRLLAARRAFEFKVRGFGRPIAIRDAAGLGPDVFQVLRIVATWVALSKRLHRRLISKATNVSFAWSKASSIWSRTVRA
jgi:hypothetical protein